MHRLSLPILAALVLAACGQPASPPPQKPAAAEPGVFDPQLKALDKAKGVEQTLADQAEAQRKSIEEAERR